LIKSQIALQQRVEHKCTCFRNFVAASRGARGRKENSCCRLPLDASDAECVGDDIFQLQHTEQFRFIRQSPYFAPNSQPCDATAAALPSSSSSTSHTAEIVPEIPRNTTQSIYTTEKWLKYNETNTPLPLGLPPQHSLNRSLLSAFLYHYSDRAPSLPPAALTQLPATFA
jgi:hypothetical protein